MDEESKISAVEAMRGAISVLEAKITIPEVVEKLISELSVAIRGVELGHIVRLFQDGDKICALMGDNIQSGAAGFGSSGAESLRALAGHLEFDGADPYPPGH